MEVNWYQRCDEVFRSRRLVHARILKMGFVSVRGSAPGTRVSIRRASHRLQMGSDLGKAAKTLGESTGDAVLSNIY